jgi:hypothetical protein
MANGIAGTVVLTQTVGEAVSLDDLERILSHPRAAAVISFLGAVPRPPWRWSHFMTRLVFTA